MRDNIDTIPYDYPVAGLTLPFNDAILSTVVTMSYDGRPLFMDPTRGEGFVTDLLILDDSTLPLPTGYTNATLG